MVVYDSEAAFAAAFKDGKLARMATEEGMADVQQTLFASAVACSLPKLAIVTGGGVAPAAAAGGVTGDSDFGTPSAP